MSDRPPHNPQTDMQDWWHTDIIEMEPGVIRYRGYAIEDLIGNVSFAQMIWLMLHGELPTREQGIRARPWQVLTHDGATP